MNDNKYRIITPTIRILETYAVLPAGWGVTTIVKTVKLEKQKKFLSPLLSAVGVNKQAVYLRAVSVIDKFKYVEPIKA